MLLSLMSIDLQRHDGLAEQDFAHLKLKSRTVEIHIVSMISRENLPDLRLTEYFWEIL